MRRFKITFIYFLSAIILMLMGFYLEKTILRRNDSARYTDKFEKTLHKKEKMLDAYLQMLRTEPEDSSSEDFKPDNPLFLNILRDEGLALFTYENDTLKFWSVNTFPIPTTYSDTLFQKNLIFLGTSWFIPRTLTEGKKIHLGLILIKYQYSYENRFLRNDFEKQFDYMEHAELDPSVSENGNLICNREGEPLFSLLYSNPGYSTFWQCTISSIYFAGLILLLLFSSKCLETIRSKRYKNTGLLVLLIFLFFLNYLFITFRIPSVIYSLDLFSPYHFAISNMMPSLGDFLISSLLIFFCIIMFFREFTFPDKLNEKSVIIRFLITFILFLAGAFYCTFTHFLFKNLLINSSISFEPFKVLDLSVYSLAGFTAISLVLVSFGFLIAKFLQLTRNLTGQKGLFLSVFLSLAAFPVFAFLTGSSIDLVVVLFYLVLVLTGQRVEKNFQYRYSALTLFIFLFALFSVYVITTETAKKERDDRKVLAVNLGAEHDPVAEIFLEELNKEIMEDQELKKLLRKEIFSIPEGDEIYRYLRNTYLIGFWEKYDLVMTICSDTSGILVNDEEYIHCFSFFDSLVSDYGNPLQDTGFYFLDNQTGNITYFGFFDFPVENSDLMNRLFIELDSKLIYEQLGYPELLLNEELSKPSPLDDYSYAKYHNQQLITQSGDFPYSLSSVIFEQKLAEFSFFEFDDYDHLIYQVNPINTVIVSKPTLRFIDVLTSFSYLFVFFFLILNLVLLLINFPFHRRTWQFNFKLRIEFSLILILLLALIMIGGGAVYFSIQQFENKHYENLSEKTRSVYIELEHKLVDEKELNPDWNSDQYASLNDLLQKFSNVFYSDINLYDGEGNLLATSRPEVFDKALLGKKINNEAYRQLRINRKAEFVHNEIIGNLQYMSAYVPFVNRDNNLLAYLNLPYFTKQSLLAKEISNLVVAIVNFSVVLILLTMALAVIISNKITSPLRLIQKKFRNIELGKASEHIYYNGNDEIGSLVGEYNRMVDELARSVELLAKSERESAWREMAKQIAHEIKNPLTPMKLSVQQLQRAWKDKAHNWEESLAKFSKTLIDQIDNLSTIATAFSDFAKMPRTRNQEVNIVTKINNSVGLFSTTVDIDFEIDLHGHSKVCVFADMEQLLRLFSNLFKNAIQSIPKERKGKIRIELLTENDKVIIKVSDNGIGIPDELGDKLFMPNFTTKSSGMGLGLAIVKNIIEDANGSIRYETEIGTGTTFIIELPLYQS